MKNLTRTPNQSISTIMALFIAMLFMFSLNVYAQEEEDIFYRTTYFKVKPGNGGKFVNIEKELWHPMQQERVKQGHILAWYLFKVKYTGTGDDYNYAAVTTYVGTDHLNNFAVADLFAKVHPDKKIEELAVTRELRDLVTHRILRQTLASMPETQGDPRKFMVVNYMRTNGNYFALRRDYVKPAFDQLVKEGKSAGWIMSNVMFPSGADMPYNNVSVDLYDEFDQIDTNALYPLIEKQNEGKNTDEIFQKLNETRRMAKRELWELIDYAR
jgi:hypothetical protein